MYKIKTKQKVLIFVAIALLLNACFGNTSQAAVQNLVFPVIGQSSYTNDFNAPRSNGLHKATDIIANKHQKIVSASNGTIQYVTWWEGAGYSIRILGTDGYTYNYYHINNDTPDTDDGSNNKMNAFGPDIEPGNPVVRGQLLGYIGDSGNAESTVPHLHFEIYNGSTAVNPYTHLNGAVRISAPRTYPQLPTELLPYGSGTFRGGARISQGDLDGDGIDELVVGAGEGGRYVKVYDTNGVQIRSFLPNGSDFLGGIDVATGDIDGDGNDEIITGAGKGGRYIKLFDETGVSLGGFLPYGALFRSGIEVTAGDIDGDGNDEIITGPSEGGTMVKVFELNGTQLHSFEPYGDFKGGVSVATGDINADPGDEIITGASKGGGPRVSIFNELGTLQLTYYAYASTFKGGIRVESAELNNPSPWAEIAVIPKTGGAPRVKLFSASGSYITYSDYMAESWWDGYYDLTASLNSIEASLNINRRTSLRNVTY